MKNPHTVRAEAGEAAIAAQVDPTVTTLIFVSAGLGALLSALMLLLGAGDPATISMGVFVATPLIPALCAALVWVALSIQQGTSKGSSTDASTDASSNSSSAAEARRQTTSAAGVLLVLAIIFFFIDWSARLDVSLFFAVMLFAWGSRLKNAELKWAALPYAAVSIALAFLDMPGTIVVAILGVLTIAWPFVRKTLTSRAS